MTETIAVARQEFRRNLRDKSFLGLATVLVVLFMVATFASARAHFRSAQEIKLLQKTVSQHWLDQPDRHPHRVAHYGYLAFRPRLTLGFFDFGVSDFAGNSIFLEAHVQNSANFSEARQDSSLLRFGTLTPAFVIQILVPLLVIFMVGQSVTKERESGTLAQVLSLGLSWRKLLTGKALGAMGVFAILLLPLYGVAAWACSRFTGGLSGDALSRLTLLALSYLIYLAVWVFLSLLVSTRSATSGRATVTLLAFWIISTIFLPKALPSFGAYLTPAPSRPDFEHRLHLEVVKGGHGHDPKAAQFKDKKELLLEQYGVSSVEELPINWRGVAMKDGEQASAKVYQKHYTELQEKYHKQNIVSEWGGLVSPYLALKHFSSSLCGTDFQSMVRFEQEAERYRVGLIQKLNDLHIHEISYDGDKAQRVSAGHWEEFEAFGYPMSSVDQDLRRAGGSLLILLVQFGVLWAGLWWTRGRVR